MFRMPDSDKIKQSDLANCPQEDPQISFLRQAGVEFGDVPRNPFLTVMGQGEIPSNLEREAVRRGVKVRDLK